MHINTCLAVLSVIVRQKIKETGVKECGWMLLLSLCAVKWASLYKGTGRFGVTHRVAG